MGYILPTLVRETIYGLTVKQCLELLAVEASIDLTTTSEQYLKILRQRLKDKILLVVPDDVEDVAILRQFYELLGGCLSSRLLVTLAPSTSASLRQPSGRQLRQHLMVLDC